MLFDLKFVVYIFLDDSLSFVLFCLVYHYDYPFVIFKLFLGAQVLRKEDISSSTSGTHRVTLDFYYIYLISVYFRSTVFNYSQICLMWPSKGTVKCGHIRQVVAKTGLIHIKYTVKENKYNIIQVIA